MKFFIISLFLLILSGCSKDNNGSESDLYGVWTKGSSFGDTLWFMKKDGKNIMRQGESFNAGMPVYGEKEYRFNYGVLEIKSFAPVSQDYYPITSFTWIQPGTEFKVQGIQLYIFMSSTNTYFTFRKL